MDDLLPEFKRTIEAARSASTATTYGKAAKRLTVFVAAQGWTWETVPADLLHRFVVRLSESGLAPRSIQVTVAGSRRFLRWLKESGRHDVPELLRPELPRQESGSQTALSSEELQRFLAAANSEQEPWRTIFLLWPLWGLRIGEVCSLKLTQVHRRKRELHIEVKGKGQKVRIVPLNKTARTLLIRWLARRPKSQWLFPSPVDPARPSTAGSIRHHMRKIRDSVNIPNLKPHKLRHVFATRLDQGGVSLRVIRDLLGHAKIETTAIYLDHSIGERSAAVGTLEEDSDE